MRRTVLLLCAALVLPACSGEDPKPRASSSPTPSVALPSTTPSPWVPDGPKPKALVRTDLIEGTGRAALPGDAMTVNYVGYHYDGKEFASSFKEGEHPLTFNLGGEEVIRGWDQGLIGMRVGGRRRLVIPPDLAYGPDGGGPGSPIGPNETLVFIVDLISATAGQNGVGNNTFAPR